MTKKSQPQKDISTEEKIIAAASKVFQKKGFAGTRTRDIAEEAGINQALLNYYFRSKQNLFDIIMTEKLKSFFTTFIPLILSNEIKLDNKIKMISENYISLLNENPDLPIFVLNAIHTEPEHFLQLVKGMEGIENSPIAQQFKKQFPHLRFEQFFLNLMGLIIFPFVMKPAITSISKSIARDFNKMMEERKKLIPLWINAMLKTK